MNKRKHDAISDLENVDDNIETAKMQKKTHVSEIINVFKNVTEMYKPFKNMLIQKIENASEMVLSHLYSLIVDGEQTNQQEDELEVLDKSLLLYICGLYHQYVTKDQVKMLEYFTKSVELNHSDAMISMGNYYKHIVNNPNYIKMDEYFQMSIKLNNSRAMYLMGRYHQYITKNYEKMLEYYQMAIQMKCTRAMRHLAGHYSIKKEYEEMAKYYRMAIDLGCSMSMNNFGVHFYRISNYIKMEEYFQMAIKMNNSSSMFHMGHYHQCITHNYEEMEKYYKMAISFGYSHALEKLIDYIFEHNLILKHISYVLEVYSSLVHSNIFRISTQTKVKKLQLIHNNVVSMEKINLDNLSCIACQSNLRNVVFLPCNHSSMCIMCAENENVNKCPICRIHIQKKNLIIWS
jgi:tetratricopeptide (TPR) repeat protein